ncbi:MAG: hypothetical protein KTR27_20620 [Leptolyngbyaceae cyanobacterium MAG.088]|nr:hypothetical protein [Leptolyngbyaceae cyanobacterium MAG.088]
MGESKHDQVVETCYFTIAIAPSLLIIAVISDFAWGALAQSPNVTGFRLVRDSLP